MRKRRRRWRMNPAQLCYLAIILAAIVYAVGIPYAQELLRPASSASQGFSSPGLNLLEAIRDRAIQTFFIAWIFFFGAAIGSFLNVVAFRMPRGESIVSHGSYCPFCATPIEARDNIPVFGWIGLRGRCRACRLPISKRYPIVEAVVGGLVLWLAMVELLSGGANLPGPQPFRRPGFAFIVFSPDWVLISLTLLHALLASMLVVWRLIEIDHSRTPWKFVMFGWLSALTAAAINGSLHPVPAFGDAPSWLATLPDWGLRLLTPLLGGMVGALVGLALDRLGVVPVLPNRDEKSHHTTPEGLASDHEHAHEPMADDESTDEPLAEDQAAAAIADSQGNDSLEMEPEKNDSPENDAPETDSPGAEAPPTNNDSNLAWAANQKRALWTAYSVIGAVLGWQSVISVAAFSAFGCLLWNLSGNWRPPRFAVLLAAVMLHLTAWKALANSTWWPGPSATIWAYVFAALIIAIPLAVMRSQAEAARVGN